MKNRLIAALAVASLLATGQGVFAQTTKAPTKERSPAATELSAVLAKIQAKARGGAAPEAGAVRPAPKKLTLEDVSSELKEIDAIVTKYKSSSPDDAAQALYYKSMVYSSFVGNQEKADEAMAQLKKDFPESKMVASMKKSEEARVERDAKLAKLVGTDATEIKATEVLGEFKGLGDLKGKVVVLDFFAHWCGPCKAALPSVRAMYDDLKGKGLEVVGVTRYYGTYKTEKGLKPEEEYARMKDFITEYKMNWPVAFVGPEAFKAYEVSGIPHVVVIDKTGKIRKVKVGYSPKEVEEFRKEIEKMVAS